MVCQLCDRNFFQAIESLPLCPHCVAAKMGDLPGEMEEWREVPEVNVESVTRAFPELDQVECIHEGRMSSVFRARQIQLDRVVALKILNPGLTESIEFQERFEREARVTAGLSHPGIVTVYEFGERSAWFFLMTEFAGGGTLADAMETGEPPFENAVDVLNQVFDAISHAHYNGGIHRDLKPGNLLFGESGRLKVADFGIVKVTGPEDFTLTSKGDQIGTPRYMAPEQLSDSSLCDKRTDIYAIGVIAFELFTGLAPTGNFPAPGHLLPQSDRLLDRAILKAISVNPRDRFDTVDQFRQALNKSKTFRSPSAIRKKSVEISKWFPWTLGALITMIIAGFAVWRMTQAAPVSFHESEGGVIRSWTPDEEKPDLSKTAQFSDFVRIGSPGSGEWWGFRKDHTVVAGNPLLNGKKVISLTRTMMLIPPGKVLSPKKGSPLHQPFSRELETNAVKMANGAGLTAALLENGKVVLAARNEIREQHRELIETIESFDGVVDLEIRDKTGGLVRDNGETFTWITGKGPVEMLDAATPVRDLDCGPGFVVAVTREGMLIVGSDQLSENHPIRNLPDNIRNATRVKVFKLLAAAQLSDGTWVSWGEDFDSGLIKTANSLPPSIDISLFAASEKKARLLWIEPR